MGYSPRGRKESDTTECLHFTSFHFYYVLVQQYTQCKYNQINMPGVGLAIFFLIDGMPINLEFGNHCSNPKFPPGVFGCAIFMRNLRLILSPL